MQSALRTRRVREWLVVDRIAESYGVLDAARDGAAATAGGSTKDRTAPGVA